MRSTKTRGAPRPTRIAGTRRPRAASAPVGLRPPESSVPKTPDKKRSRLTAALFAIAGLLVAAGGWFTVSTPADSTNTALVDTAATAEVSGQIRGALERIFSYRHDDAAATRRAARETLTGDAVRQYESLFTPVTAAGQPLVLRSTVVISGVSLLAGDRAALLVFLDQTATRGDTGATTSGGAQLSVTAQRVDGRWRIATLRPR